MTCFFLLILMLSNASVLWAQNSADRQTLDSIGAQNAVRKARQMTDIVFVPKADIVANKRYTYREGKTYTGLIYSSVKETSTYVGQDVSIHTFMTALHNPRSLIYTERIDLPPYHGINAAAYYGTVCSAFVSYALGLSAIYRSADFAKADFMEYVEDQSATGIQLADVLWQKGHVAMITGIGRNDDGKIGRIEISEARRLGCTRSLIESEKGFNEMLDAGNWKIFRYRYLYKNLSYKPANEFVAVDGETLIPFNYNNDICTNHGDKACFIAGDTVVLNISEGYKSLEIYKDSVLYQTIELGKDTDIQLAGLSFGDYRARVIKDAYLSEFIYWKVVDVHVDIDVKRGIVSFHSANATPVYVEFCNASGVWFPSGLFELSEEELLQEEVNVSSFLKRRMPSNKSIYIKVHFECEYGRVINKPIKLSHRELTWNFLKHIPDHWSHNFA